MVKPDRAPARTARLGLILSLGLATGCALVPKSRLDDAAKITQALRAENAQLRDQTLSLKGENADLSDRALGDTRRIAALEQSVDRLETSVQGYIDEREDLVDKFQRFRRLAQASAASPPSSAMISRLKAFASGHGATTLDPTSGVLWVEADALFVPGTDRLRPGASRWLDDCGALLAEPEARAWPVLVAGHSSASPVRLASSGDTGESPGDLSLSRAVRVRDALARRSGRDPARIGVAGLGTSHPLSAGTDDKARTGDARIEIEIGPAADRAIP